MTLFDAEALHLDGSVLVTLTGELDMAGIEKLETLARTLIHRYDADQVVLDCEHLTFIDPVGLGALIAVNTKFGGGRISLRNVQRQFLLVLERTGTTQQFQLVDRTSRSEAEAR